MPFLRFLFLSFSFFLILKKKEEERPKGQQNEAVEEMTKTVEEVEETVEEMKEAVDGENRAQPQIAPSTEK
ncbi:hypothetical protein [Uliginosibacterium flavum]|uniref:Uncharacterized protein n=1 Tax=Uliginosibacterium flavum TaxID=1396831 RepID=A0ABV2TPM2_9RHOO